MDIVEHHERAAAMRRGGHVAGGFAGAAGEVSSQVRPFSASVWGGGRRRSRRYGAAPSLFNARRCLAALALLVALAVPLAGVPAVARTPQILALGDSITAGLGLSAQAS